MGRPLSAVAIRHFGFISYGLSLLSRDLLLSYPLGLFPHLLLLSLAARALTFSAGYLQSLVCFSVGFTHPISSASKRTVLLARPGAAFR